MYNVPRKSQNISHQGAQTETREVIVHSESCFTIQEPLGEREDSINTADAEEGKKEMPLTTCFSAPVVQLIVVLTGMPPDAVRTRGDSCSNDTKPG